MFLHEQIIYKRFLLLMSVLLAVASLTACGGTNSSQSGKNETAVSGEVNSSNKAGKNEPSSSSGSDEMTYSALAPPAAGITKYMNAKNIAYEGWDSLTTSITASDDPMASLAILPFITTDMSVIPITMLAAIPSKGDHLWEGKFTAWFHGTGRIVQKGDLSTFEILIEAKDGSQGNMTITGDYDAKKDSMKAVFMMDGQETGLFEFAASGNGYVSQFFLSEGGETFLVKNAFEGSNLYAGMISDSGKPDSIYQKSFEVGEGFAHSDSMMVVFNNGSSYALIDGKKVGN